MDCVNHPGVGASAYCQSCGKALCPGCVQNVAGGQIFCQPCWTTWQAYQQPFAAARAGGPNASSAAVLGLIPGVGAMYNGQFFKGLIHVVIFAVLVSITHTVHGIFGIFVGAWVLYQSFEAFHTAKALRDGQPLPDPLGLNEVGNWLNLGGRPHNYAQPSTGAPTQNPGPSAQGPAARGYQTPYTGQYQAPHPSADQQPQYQAPITPPVAGFTDPGVPPMPPIAPLFWRRKEPVGAVVLIGLGLLFLLGQLDIFEGRLWEFAWPLGLIGLGVWLMIRRLGDSHGGSK